MIRKLLCVVSLLMSAGAGAQTIPSSTPVGNFLDIGGVKLWYEECGAANLSAAGVVLLHDGLVHSITSRIWDPSTPNTLWCVMTVADMAGQSLRKIRSFPKTICAFGVVGSVERHGPSDPNSASRGTSVAIQSLCFTGVAPRNCSHGPAAGGLCVPLHTFQPLRNADLERSSSGSGIPRRPLLLVVRCFGNKIFLRTDETEIEFQKDASGKVVEMIIHNSDGRRGPVPALHARVKSEFEYEDVQLRDLFWGGLDEPVELLAVLLLVAMSLNAQSSKPRYLPKPNHMCKATLADGAKYEVWDRIW